MNAIKEFRRDTPAMTDEAAAAARARLMTAIQEPGVTSKPGASRTRRLGWRIAVATAMALVVGGTVVVVRDQPGLEPVAGVAELGERAARAAENDPMSVPGPEQWLYSKELRLTQGDPVQREIWERWTRVDGKLTAWYQDGKLGIQGGAVFDPAELAGAPVTPAAVTSKITAAILDEDRRGSQELNGSVPPVMLFREINQLVSEQWLAPEVRAALFRALPSIQGVTVAREVAVADGRRGVAFSLTADGARVSLVLDPRSFRYLGTNANGGTTGTVSLTAQLEAMIVDQPGQRP